ncbi:hypothetical protein ACQRIT_000234 [Beauveria bassiana]
MVTHFNAALRNCHSPKEDAAEALLQSEPFSPSVLDRLWETGGLGILAVSGDRDRRPTERDKGFGQGSLMLAPSTGYYRRQVPPAPFAMPTVVVIAVITAVTVAAAVAVDIIGDVTVDRSD